MRRIRLETLYIEHVRSFAVEHVEFSSAPGLKYVTGDNQTEPDLGANGCGKSSLWDALVWCLYGTSVRGQRASDIVRWGAQRPLVAAIFKDDQGATLQVARKGSPERITINSLPAVQSDVDHHLGLTRPQFLASVLFGQMVPLFADLPAPKRGELLDDVLGLEVWRSAEAIAKERIKVAVTTLGSLKQDVASLTAQLDALDIGAVRGMHDDWAKDHESRVQAAIEIVARLEAELAALPNPQPEKPPDVLPIMQEFSSRIGGLNKSRDSAHRLYEFFLHTEICPTCSQTINQGFAAAEAEERRVEVIQFDNAIKDLEGKRQQIGRQNLTARERYDMELAQQHEFKIVTNKFENAVNTAERLVAESMNPYAAILATTKARQADLQAALAIRQLSCEDADNERHIADYWTDAFKRIRLGLVKRTLAALEVETNAVAATLGLIGWRVAYRTETETKSGGVKLGIQLQVTSPVASAPWESWSGGEGQRVRLAVALGLSAFIQRMCGVEYDFEVWDEPTNWLSAEGIADVISVLDERSTRLGRSIYLLDHRAHDYPGFKEVWLVEKDADGSRITKIKE